MAKRAQQARCNKCVHNDEGKGCDLNSDFYMTAQSFTCKDYDRDKKKDASVVKLEPQKQKPRVKVFNSDEVCYRFYE